MSEGGGFHGPWNSSPIRNVKEQFPADSKFSKKVVVAASENGLYLHGASGSSGPFNVEYVMLAPWYSIMKNEVGLIVDKLRHAIETVSQGVT